MAREAYEKYHKYSQAVLNANAHIKKQEETCKTLAGFIKEVEENRALLCKSLLLKYFKFTQELASLYATKAQSFIASLSLISCQSPTPPENSPFQPIERAQYIFTAGDASGAEAVPGKFASDEQYFDAEAQGTIRRALESVVAGASFDLEEKSGLLSWLNTPLTRSYFAHFLKEIALDLPVLSREGYQSIKELCNYLLTEWITQSDNQESTLDNVLLASKGIVGQIDNTREFLYSQIIRHGVWQEIDIWKKLIDKKIEGRVDQFESMKSKRSGLFGKVRSAMASGLSAFFLGGLEDFSGPESLQCKAALNTLAKFCYFLSTPFISVDKVIKLYKAYGKQYDIPKNKMRELELELMKCQRAPTLKVPKHKSILSKAKRKLAKYNHYYILSLTVQFVPDKPTLRNLLLLSAKANMALRTKVFRRVLMDPDTKVGAKERVAIWKQAVELVCVRARVEGRGGLQEAARRGGQRRGEERN